MGLPQLRPEEAASHDLEFFYHVPGHAGVAGNGVQEADLGWRRLSGGRRNDCETGSGKPRRGAHAVATWASPFVMGAAECSARRFPGPVPALSCELGSPARRAQGEPTRVRVQRPAYNRDVLLVSLRALTCIAALMAATLVWSAAAEGHHGSAEYDVTREVTVTGTVTEWRWTNPHTWFFVSVKGADGAQAWSGEGPPLNWAQARGWSKAMFVEGETVTLYMYPSRREPRSGLVKRIERRNGEVIPVTRPWLGERP